MTHPAPPKSQAESSGAFLDFVVVLARHFYLLLLAPLAAGAAAYYSVPYLPQTFESKSYVSVETADAKQMEALLRTPTVLDRLAEKYKVAGRSPELRRDALDARIRIATAKGADVKAGGLYTLTAIANDPAVAKALNRDLLDAWLELTKPGPVERASIKQQLAWAEENIAQQSEMLNRLTNESAKVVDQGVRNGFVTSIDILRDKRDKAIQLFERLTLRLQGGGSDKIVSEPTSPVEPVWPRRSVVTLGTVVGTGMLLLVLVTLLHLWRAGMSNPAISPKLNEIRSSLVPFMRSGGRA